MVHKSFRIPSLQTILLIIFCSDSKISCIILFKHHQAVLQCKPQKRESTQGIIVVYKPIHFGDISAMTYQTCSYAMCVGSSIWISKGTCIGHDASVKTFSNISIDQRLYPKCFYNLIQKFCGCRCIGFSKSQISKFFCGWMMVYDYLSGLGVTDGWLHLMETVQCREIYTKDNISIVEYSKRSLSLFLCADHHFWCTGKPVEESRIDCGRNHSYLVVLLFKQSSKC
mmetsp:Transcript_6246/g.14076  ORF Transcript_6246/g.14076 Transcript_6246/m.14076 type:complete len:226 (-) Transcript_6246:1580-2257(-)